jgi:hypothetical protein
MNNNFAQQVALAVQAITIRSPHAYTWFGEPSPRLPRSVVRQLTTQMARDYLLSMLQTRLYASFYCYGLPRPTDRNAPLVRTQGIESFILALSTANSGMGYWQGGWQVAALDDNEVVAGRDGVRVWAPAEACWIPGGGQMAPDAPVSLYFPKESRSLSPGFYMAFGDAELVRQARQSVVRIYWHLMSQGAVRFVRRATFLLNRAGIPFTLKVLNDPSLFTRCDAAVLYLLRSHYEQAAEILAKIYGSVEDVLKPGTPALTKQLAAGVGLAEDPGSEDSFGQHRCHLLADGVLRAYEHGRSSREDRLSEVIDRLADAGVAIEHPYLNPGSIDRYEFYPVPLTPHQLTSSMPLDQSGPVDFLQVAAQIAQRLTHEAIWDTNRAVWVGLDPRSALSTWGSTTITYRPLGPDLYAGTSGVALFLAEFFAVTGDLDARRTARGAIEHSLTRLEGLPSLIRHGFFTGWAGIALATVRIGAILNDADLTRRGVELLHRLGRERDDEHEFDLLSGDAGAILALLIVHDLLRDDGLLNLARELGDGLLRTAQRVDETCAWRSPAFAGQRPLTGFSHGTAGVAYALLELYRRTGEPSYRDSARMAFAYERTCFDASVGNWLDLRHLPLRGRSRKRTGSFMTAWCHGAPGIALSRLRAFQLLGDRTSQNEAMVAIATTRAAVEAALSQAIGDFSPCHGLAGLVEVLLHGDRILGQESATSIVTAAARTGIVNYASGRQLWPCGAGAGETPGLMLGLAGIGYFYLRLHDPTVPSLLLPDGAEFVALHERPLAEQSASGRSDGQLPVMIAQSEGLDEHELADMVLGALKTHGFDMPVGELTQAMQARWYTGCRLRDRILPNLFPPFADPLDYVMVADSDPFLWNSLPFMMAFGYQQSLALQVLAQVPPHIRGDASNLCAAFSTLLSVFDYLVDESSERATVFEIERAVLPHMFDGDGDVQRYLTEAYRRTSDPRVRLLCILFGVSEAGFRGLHHQSQNGAAWADLAEVMGRLFGAERKVTLTQVASHGEMESLVPDNEAKSVLPFVTMLQILTLAGSAPKPSAIAMQAAETLGKAVAMADDLMDLLSDYRRQAPSPLVLRLAKLVGQGNGTVTEAELQQVISAGVEQLIALLQPKAFGLMACHEAAHAPGIGDDESTQDALSSVLEFARLTVARWVKWPDDPTINPPADAFGPPLQTYASGAFYARV